ncbi:MAG: NAD(P)H-binding protein [Kouleothrix sp.]
MRLAQGLSAALEGVDVVVHAASSPARNTRAVDVDGTRRLLKCAHQARVAHLVYVSIVGCAPGVTRILPGQDRRRGAGA